MEGNVIMKYTEEYIEMRRGMYQIYRTEKTGFKGRKECRGTQKRRLIKERGMRCEKCRKTQTYLELDHIIPVSCGGCQVSDDNMQLLCKECHKEKTGFDRLFLNYMIKLKIIRGVGHIHYFYVHPKTVARLYEKLSILSKKSIDLEKINYLYI